VHTLTIEHSVISVMAGWIVDRLFVLSSIDNAMYNGLKLSEYEAYWLTDFPLSTHQEIIMVIFKKQINKKKEIFVVNRDKI